MEEDFPVFGGPVDLGPEGYTDDPAQFASFDMPSPPTQIENTSPPPAPIFSYEETGTKPIVPDIAFNSKPVEQQPVAPLDFTSDPATNSSPVVPHPVVDMPPAEQPVSSKRVDSIMASPVGPVVSDVAQRLGFPADKLAAIVSIESSGNPFAGASGPYKGLGQLNSDEWKRYGNGGNILDAKDNLEATVRSLQDKEQKFKTEFGRDPSATELYMMHQQGEAGLRSHLAHPDWPAWQSMLATGEGARKGEAWAKKAIWGNVPSDVRSQFGSVDNITSKDFLNIWDAKLHGGAVSSTAFNNPVTPSQITAPAPAATENALRQYNIDKAAKDEQRPWYDNVVTEAFQQSNLTTRALSLVAGSKQFDPDPNFVLTPDVQNEVMKQYGLAEPYRSSLTNAVSLDHAKYLAQQAQDDQSRVQYLADHGAVGVGASIFASLVDPAAIAAGAATGGVADAAAVLAGVGRAGRVAAQALAGAGVNVALDQASRAAGDVNAGQDIPLAAATGALFGSAYGLLSRNPATIEEAIQLRKAGQTLKNSLEDSSAITPVRSRSAGAAENPNTNDTFIKSEAVENLRDAQVPYTVDKLFGTVPIRFSAAGMLKSSKNALSRLAAGIGLDAVGWKDRSVNEFSSAEEADLLLRQHMMRLHSVWDPSATEYAKDQGSNLLGRYITGSEFNDQVYRYVVNTSKDVEFHPAVKRVGDRIRELNADILRMAKNPGERAGLVSRAVRGFEEVKENPHYMMRVYAGEKVNAMREQYGDKGLKAWAEGAIRKAQPDLKDDEVEKLAKWHVKRITERANGIDEKLNLAMSGFDREQLKEVMGEAGLDPDRIDKLLNTVKEDKQVGADVRAKHRLMLDENFVLRNYPKSTGGTGDLSLHDLVVTDAALLSHIYFKHMTGRIALANFKIRNPETGELIVNGITSDNEFDALKKRISEWAGDNLKGNDAKKANEYDLANLQYMYDHILGRSDQDATGAMAKWLRRSGDVNYIRLGANFGFAQMPETVAPIAHLGVRALMNVMPAFRRIVTGGEAHLADEMARDVEAMWGLGTDHMKGFQYFRHEDTGALPQGFGSKTDNVLNFGKQMVSHASGLHLINAALQRWTGKAVIQKFADLARKAVQGTDGAINLEKLSPSQLNRMRYLGLSDDMLKRVLKQVRENFTEERGMLFDHKVTRLNMDKWKDQEARAAFENAGFRWARNIIQENDVGAMHRWMSKPMARMLMQFRVFPLVAWDKQFLHNIHMRDMTSFNLMWMTLASGAATYALQTQIAAATRSDRADYLTKRLSPKNLALAGFQRAGWTTLLPTMWDTGAYALGGSPAFDFRTSGQPSDAIFGNPTMSMIDDLSKASKGLVQPWVDGRERSQQEYRNMMRALPLATWLPATSLLSTMISSKPLYPPKNNTNN